MNPDIFFTYRNHRGALEERRLRQAILEHQPDPGHGHQPGWFLTGLCADRNAVRSFALVNVILPSNRQRVTLATLGAPE
jgi:hypothetical protein